MKDFASLGLGLCVTEKKSYGPDVYERREELRLLSDNCVIASFSTRIRISAGEQILSTHTDFIQGNGLNIIQIRAVCEWIRDLSIAAPWRLTAYTTMAGTVP